MLATHTCCVAVIEPICSVSSLFPLNGTFSPVTVRNQPETGCRFSCHSLDRTSGQTIVMVLPVSIVSIQRLPSIVPETMGLSSDPAKDRNTVIQMGLRRNSRALPLKPGYWPVPDCFSVLGTPSGFLFSCTFLQKCLMCPSSPQPQQYKPFVLVPRGALSLDAGVALIPSKQRWMASSRHCCNFSREPVSTTVLFTGCYFPYSATSCSN